MKQADKRDGRINLPLLISLALFAPALSLMLFAALSAVFEFHLTSPAIPEPALLFNPMAVVLAVAYGVIPAFVFGSLGCMAATAFLSQSSAWLWSLAGAGSALAYVVVFLVMGLVFNIQEPTLWIGPFIGTSDRPPAPVVASGSIVFSIVAAGAVAASLYRAATKPLSLKGADKRS
jgi:hypothetical protein